MTRILKTLLKETVLSLKRVYSQSGSRFSWWENGGRLWCSCFVERAGFISCSEASSVNLPVTYVAESLKRQCPSSHRKVEVRRAYMFPLRRATQSECSHTWRVSNGTLLSSCWPWEPTFWPTLLSLPKARRMCPCPQAQWSVPTCGLAAATCGLGLVWGSRSSTPVAAERRHILAVFCRLISVIPDYKRGPSEQYRNHFPWGARSL